MLEEGFLLSDDKGLKWDWCDSLDHNLGFSCAIVSFWSGSKSILILFRQLLDDPAVLFSFVQKLCSTLQLDEHI
jgi:hypothetical protein